MSNRRKSMIALHCGSASCSERIFPGDRSMIFNGSRAVFCRETCSLLRRLSDLVSGQSRGVCEVDASDLYVLEWDFNESWFPGKITAREGRAGTDPGVPGMYLVWGFRMDFMGFERMILC